MMTKEQWEEIERKHKINLIEERKAKKSEWEKDYPDLRFLKSILKTKPQQEKFARKMSEILTNYEVSLNFYFSKNGKIILAGYHYCDYSVGFEFTDYTVNSKDYNNAEINKKYLKFMHGLFKDEYKDAFFKNLTQKHKQKNKQLKKELF